MSPVMTLRQLNVLPDSHFIRPADSSYVIARFCVVINNHHVSKLWWILSIVGGRQYGDITIQPSETVVFESSILSGQRCRHPVSVLIDKAAMSWLERSKHIRWRYGTSDFVLQLILKCLPRKRLCVQQSVYNIHWKRFYTSCYSLFACLRSCCLKYVSGSCILIVWCSLKWQYDLLRCDLVLCLDLSLQR